MFKKLITNLPFNPSLLTQVSFYAKRLRQEESVRRLGFGFMALAMLTQVFAVMAPPQKSLAFSNDYIVNGLNSRDDLIRAWDGQTGDTHVAEIYGRFGLTRADIVALPLFPNATVRSDQADYWTIGRQSLSAVSKAGRIKQQYKNSEVPINTGSTTVFLRQLRAWDIDNPVNSYQAFQGTKNGQTFFILQDCGNFTTVGPPPVVTPPPIDTFPPPDYVPPPPAPLPEPKIELRKSIEGGTAARKPGDEFTFRFEYRNSVPNSKPATNVKITDTLDLDHFDIVSANGIPATADFLRSLGALSGNVLTINLGSVSYTADYQSAATLVVRLKTSLDNGLKICNVATMAASNAATVTSGGEGLCFTVINPCPLDGSVSSATDARCTTPILACSLTQASVNRSNKESTLVTTVTSSNPSLTHVVSYDYNFGDNATKRNASTALTDTVKHTYQDGKYNATATVNYTIGSDSGTSHTVACVGDIETQPDQPLTPSKSAQNITQALNSVQTLTTKAKANDIIEYTLTTHNSYNYDRVNYSVNDYVGDLLDYTNLDKAFLTSQGGTFDEATRTVNWTGKTVKADDDLTLKFRVMVKDPVPATNQPGTMTTAFDCVISNKYGTEISIPIDCPVVKGAEYINIVLPNTGPGTSLLIGFAGTFVIAYFFARSRLIGRELELVRAEYSTGGGF